jgi:peptidoglycan/LPS O-acetylase OafA/YrhL
LAGIAQATSGPIYRLLTTPLFAWLGTISYSLYLWHPMILGVVKFAMYKLGIVALAHQAAPLVFFALAVPPALIVAHVSQRLLETRATNWLRARFGARRESRVSVAGSRSGL